MVLFSERKRLEEAYYEWQQQPLSEPGTQIQDCPFSVVTFLVSQSLLDEDKVKAFLKARMLPLPNEAMIEKR